jgi:hypothetical protein
VLKECQKCDQHGGHIDREAQPVGRASRNCREEILITSPPDRCEQFQRSAALRSQVQFFRHRERARRSHDNCRQQMFGFYAESNIGRHDGAGDMRHPASHNGHQFRWRLQLNGTAIRGEEVRQAQHRQEAEDARETTHYSQPHRVEALTKVSTRRSRAAPEPGARVLQRLDLGRDG